MRGESVSDDEVEDGYYVGRQLDPSEQHTYLPAKRDGQCLHRMAEGHLCQLTDPEAWHHRPVLSESAK